MRKLLPLLALILFAMVTTASAEVKEFGPDFCRYSVDVLDGWQVGAPNGNTTTFESPDKKAGVVVVAGKFEKPMTDAEFETFVRDAAKKLGLDDVQKTDDSSYILNGKVNGLDFRQLAAKQDNVYASITMSGDLTMAQKIAESIEFKD